MMPKERFKVSSVTPERVNHFIPSSSISSQRVRLYACLACILHSCMFARVSSLCAHDSESFDVFGLSLFLQDNLSCLVAPRVRNHNTQISPPPCRMQQWANCPNIQDLWGVKHLAGPQHITSARFGERS